MLVLGSYLDKLAGLGSLLEGATHLVRVKLRVGWLEVICFLIAWMLEPLRSLRALMASKTI